jgi:hypothetical protein
MFAVEAFGNALRKLAEILRRHGIRFHLTGGISSAVYGQPRMTQDLDVVVDPVVIGACLDEFLETLSASDFLFDELSVRSAVGRQGMFQLLDKTEALKLDLYARELIAGELDRSQSVEVFEGEFYPVVSRSDAVLSKLVWIGMGSHKSRQDLRRMYRLADGEARAQIASEASKMQLGKLLEDVLAEPDELE